MRHTELADRGFQIIEHPNYPQGDESRLVAQSSAIGDYEDSLDVPGSSYLWIGQSDGPSHHLNREEVTQLRDYLDHWLETGNLYPEPDPAPQSPHLKAMQGALMDLKQNVADLEKDIASLIASESNED